MTLTGTILSNCNVIVAFQAVIDNVMSVTRTMDFTWKFLAYSMTKKETAKERLLPTSRKTLQLSVKATCSSKAKNPQDELGFVYIT